MEHRYDLSSLLYLLLLQGDSQSFNSILRLYGLDQMLSSYSGLCKDVFSYEMHERSCLDSLFLICVIASYEIALSTFRWLNLVVCFEARLRITLRHNEVNTNDQTILFRKEQPSLAFTSESKVKRCLPSSTKELI